MRRRLTSPGREGIFAEPRGAYALAACAAEAGTGRIGKDYVVVVIVSGTGLKDMAAAAEFATRHNLRFNVDGVVDLGVETGPG